MAEEDTLFFVLYSLCIVHEQGKVRAHHVSTTTKYGVL